MNSTGNLAPPMFPYAAPVTGDATGTVLPFGISRALPVERPAVKNLPTVTYCPERQLSLFADTGEPFIHAPSMASEFETLTQTQEDMQLFDDNEGTDND